MAKLTDRAESPLDPLAQYLINRAFTVSDLLAAIKPSDMPVAYEALSQLSQSDPDLEFLQEDIEAHQGLRKAEQELVAREIIPEVNPVLETEGRNILLKRREQADADARGDSPPSAAEAGGSESARFAVRNLRSTLEKLHDVARPPRERQMELEHASYEAAHAELEHSAGLLSQQKKAASAQEDQKLQRQQLQGWMYQWLGQLKAQLREDIFQLRNKLEGSAETTKDAFADLGNGPVGLKDNALTLYLTLLPVDKLAIITVIEIMRQSGGHGVADGMKVTRAMLAVGKAVETEYRAETIRNVAGADSSHWLKTLDPQTQKPSQILVGKVWKKLGNQLDNPNAGSDSTASLEKAQEDDLRAVWTPPWSQMAHLGVGSFLVEKLLQVAKVERSAIDPETDEVV